MSPSEVACVLADANIDLSSKFASSIATGILRKTGKSVNVYRKSAPFERGNKQSITYTRPRDPATLRAVVSVALPAPSDNLTCTPTLLTVACNSARVHVACALRVQLVRLRQRA